MFEGIKNLSDIFSKMGDMKAQSAEIQKRMESIHVTGNAGAGMVVVTASGKGEILNVKINHTLFEADDSQMIEDLVISATNDALRKAKEAMEYEIKKSIGVSPEDMINLMKNKGGSESV